MSLPAIEVYPPGAGTAVWTDQIIEERTAPSVSRVYTYTGATATANAGYVFAHWDFWKTVKWSGTAPESALPDGSRDMVISSNEYVRTIHPAQSQTFINVPSSLTASDIKRETYFPAAIYFQPYDVEIQCKGDAFYDLDVPNDNTPLLIGDRVIAKRFDLYVYRARAVFWPIDKFNKLIYDPYTNLLESNFNNHNRLDYYPNAVN